MKGLAVFILTVSSSLSAIGFCAVADCLGQKAADPSFKITEKFQEFVCSILIRVTVFVKLLILEF